LITEVQRVAEVLLTRYGHVHRNDAYAWPYASQRVLDCVLSLNRQYNAVVRPRVERFAARRADIQSLKELLSLMRQYPSPHAFCVAELEYNDARRAKTLIGVVDYLLDAQVDHPGADECERLTHWASWCRPGDHLTVGVQGFGLAGFQYLRMLFGAQTVKPDVHIINFVSELLERPLTPVQALNIMERAAALVHLPLREVDAEIWRERAAP
jgi:hypothetical protein